MKESAILLIHCPDQKGIVLAVTEFIFGNSGNVISLDQHVDHENGAFFMRVQWQLEGFQITKDKIAARFETLVGSKFEIEYNLYFSGQKPKMALFVSKYPHCMYDLLSRHQTGDLKVDIPLIISNHPDLESDAKRFGIDFHCLPVTKDNKAEQEAKQMELLAKYEIDFAVLARYMQILSSEFVKQFENRIINIHHSFLPAFPGAKPYHSAYERGVKIIGATSHYVTEDLDCGPIIEQNVVRVNHKNSIQDLVMKGKDLEKMVLATAVRYHVERRILTYKNKTVIFD